MKHILNNLTEQEKNSIREQHTGGMKVMTESFSKLLNSKLGDVKPILSEQYYLGDEIVHDVSDIFNRILSGSGDSGTKVKEFCDICNKSGLLSYRDTGRANRFADVIRDAVQGVGTNEESIYKVFEDLKSFDEFCGMVKAYKDSYNVDLYTDLSDDISDESEWVRIMRPIRNLVKNIQPSENQVGPPLTPGQKAEMEKQAQRQVSQRQQPTSPTSRMPFR